eukprot:GEMP01056288.1.p1 GENE.GEMP01056288.1~~GEMP01056288.1.p1  ORF type:complete len:407 (+),score=97.25 GEMP01056288.1:204-1424(+)
MEGDIVTGSFTGRLSRKRSFGNKLFFGDLYDDTSSTIVEAKFDQKNFPGCGEDFVRLLRKRLKLGDVLRVYGATMDVHNISKYKQTCSCAACGGVITLMVLVERVEVLEAWNQALNYHPPLLTINSTPDANGMPATNTPITDDETARTTVPSSSASPRTDTPSDEDNFAALCKFFVANGQCGRTNCTFVHQAIDKRRYAQWLHDRRAQRSRQADDPHENKEAHAQRAKVFGDWIEATYFRSSASTAPTSIVDVAGGKGDLAFDLRIAKDLCAVKVVDPRPMKASRRMQRALGVSSLREAQAILEDRIPQFFGKVEDDDEIHGPQLWAGMHPDQATGAIVEEAIKRGDPFAVVPCCVFSDDFPDRSLPDGKRVRTHEDLIAWIRAKDPHTEVEYLNFTGKNVVVFRR